MENKGLKNVFPKVENEFVACSWNIVFWQIVWQLCKISICTISLAFSQGSETQWGALIHLPVSHRCSRSWAIFKNRSFFTACGNAGSSQAPSKETMFSLLQKFRSQRRKRYPWGASPAVLCITGLCKIIETKCFRSTETFSITWTMNGMRGMLISSRIFFFPLNKYSRLLITLQVCSYPSSQQLYRVHT